MYGGSNDNNIGARVIAVDLKKGNGRWLVVDKRQDDIKMKAMYGGW